MKKDIWIMTLRTIVWLALLSYVIYLSINQADIIPTKAWNFDLTVYIILWILACMMIIVWITRPCFKKPRTFQVIMGIAIILFVNYIWIQDSSISWIFLKDILSILWAIIIVLWFTKVCVYDKCKKQQEEEEVEIIEV